MKSFYEIFFYFREFSIAAIIIVALCIIYNFLYRKEVNAIKKELTDSAAVNPESAIVLDKPELSKSRRFFRRRILRDGSSLRKCVGCVDQEGRDRNYDEKSRNFDFAKTGFYIKNENGTAFNYKGETTVAGLIVSLLILLAAGILFILFFPTVYKYLAENLSNLFGMK